MLLGTPISPAPLIGRALVEFLGSIGPEGGLTTEGSIDPRTGLVAKPGGEFTENKEKSYYGGKASNRGPNKERLINTVLDTPEILQPNFTDDQLTAILQQGFRNQVDNTFTDNDGKPKTDPEELLECFKDDKGWIQIGKEKYK